MDCIKKWIMFASMKVEKKKQRESGSIKIDPEIYRQAADFCDKKGLKITFFATEAVTEKLDKELQKEKK